MVIFVEARSNAVPVFSVPALGGQLPHVGRLAQAALAEAHALRVMEKDAILLPGPHRVGLEQPRSLYLKEQPTRPPATQDGRLVERRLVRIEAIVTAQDFADVPAQVFEGRERDDRVHAWC
jgi:hypothetical protein